MQGIKSNLFGRPIWPGRFRRWPASVFVAFVKEFAKAVDPEVRRQVEGVNIVLAEAHH